MLIERSIQVIFDLFSNPIFIFIIFIPLFPSCFLSRFIAYSSTSVAFFSVKFIWLMPFLAEIKGVFFYRKKRVGFALFLCILHYSTCQLGGWGDIYMRKAIKTDSNIQNTTQITTTTSFWNMKYAIKLPKRQIGVLINRRRKVNSCLLGTETCASFIMSSIVEDCFYYTWSVSVNELGDSKDHSEDFTETTSELEG